MLIRRYTPSDCEYLAKLFYQTVHTINAKDYTDEQLDAWADGSVDLKEWNRTFLEHFSIVAVLDDRIVGFGDIDTKPFFMSKGYKMVKEQQVYRKGISLTNYFMEKDML